MLLILPECGSARELFACERVSLLEAGEDLLLSLQIGSSQGRPDTRG